MRVLLIYPDIDTLTPVYYQLGVGSLAATLRAAGHEPRFLRLPELDRARLTEEIRRFDPGLIGFSSVYVQWRYVRQMAGWIKETFGLPVVAGGVHPTLSPDECIAEKNVDFICRGEGEEALLDLVEAIAAGKPTGCIPNIWTRAQDGRIIVNEMRELADNLDRLPPPDRECLDYREALTAQLGNVQILTSRGCPYRCTYCSNEAQMRLYSGNGRFIRQRSVENVIAEIGDILTKYPDHARYLTFSDDIITENKKWLYAFLDEYKRQFDLPFSMQVQMQTFGRETARRLAEAGCYQAIIAIESGDDYIRREVMNRNLTDEQILNTFRFCDEVGIETCSYNIVGVPGETEQSVRSSMALVEKANPDHSLVFKFTPFPGTKLHEVCVSEGYLKNDDHDNYFSHVGFMDLPTISKERLTELYYEFFRLVNRINAKKRRSKLGSYFDFFDELPKARLRTRDPRFVSIEPVRVDSDERPSILCHPDSEIRYKLRLEPNTTLKFGVTLSPMVWSPDKGDGVEFRVEARGLLGRTVLFEKKINPKRNREDRRWHDAEIDLSRYSGKTMELAFVTKAQGSPDFCSSYWGEPVLFTRAAG